MVKDRLLADPNLRIAYDINHLLWTMEGLPDAEGSDANSSTIELGYICLDPHDQYTGGHN